MNWWEWVLVGFGVLFGCAVLCIAAAWADAWKH